MTNFGNAGRSSHSVDEENGASRKLTVVICPKAKLPAEVGLNAMQNIESCSRWNGSSYCSRTCLPQIRFCADGLQEFTARYEGKICTSCGAPLMAIDWYDTRLMALEAEAVTEGNPLGGALPQDDAPICSTCFRGSMH